LHCGISRVLLIYPLFEFYHFFWDTHSFLKATRDRWDLVTIDQNTHLIIEFLAFKWGRALDGLGLLDQIGTGMVD
jgi:hypothetical protein